MITKDAKFGKILGKHPELAEVFLKSGMHCLGCAAAAFETIKDGAEAHGINVEKLVEDLNKALKKEKVKK